jgi:predicted MFS family arabinose efflux permease
MQSMASANRRLLIFIILSSFLLNLGFQVWQTLFNNFAVEDIGAGAGAVGLIQAVREVPGLLAIAIGVLALFISEMRIMSASVILLGVGMALSGQAHGITSLLIATFIMSVGFHFYMPCSNAVMLMITGESDTPRMLGSLGSLASLAAVAGTLIVYFVAAPLGYRNLFTWVGIAVIAGGVLLLPFGGNRQSLPAGRHITLRRRYWLYYTLSFLLGCRRHIFTTFAIYLLVREYHVPIQTTALLYLVNGVINVLTLRLTGQMVGRIGERMALSVTFASLALVFLGYAYIALLPVLFVLFVIDNVFFGFNIALTTYFQKIAVSPEEITSNLSTEQAINHIAAIVVPLTGGTVWMTVGPQAVFLFGVGIVLAGLVLTQLMRIAPRASVAPASTPQAQEA